MAKREKITIEDLAKDIDSLSRDSVTVVKGISSLMTLVDNLAIMTKHRFDDVDEKFEHIDKSFGGQIQYLNNRLDTTADHERRITRLVRKAGIAK